MTFLLDANVLIDLGYINGLDVLPSLGTSEVLDVVLLECEHPKQPNLIYDIQKAGVCEIPTEKKWASAARIYRTGRLSFQDALSFYYTKAFSRTLLTNEQPLRNRCFEEDVPVHGVLWVIEQAYVSKLKSASQLCDWLLALEMFNRRPPQAELSQLRQKLGCSQSIGI